MHFPLAMTNKRTVFLLGSTLIAGLVAALLALAVVSGPAVSQEMKPLQSSVPKACEKATWPYIPAECLQRVSNGGATAEPVRSFTYARQVR